MSRSEYYEDGDDDLWAMIRWRGAVASSIRGRRGQAMLKELLSALDAMPRKRLVSGELMRQGVDGEWDCCTIGCLALARGLDWSDGRENAQIAIAMNVAEPLVREIEYLNDDYYSHNPEKRFAEMRAWVASQIAGDKS